ncbi:histone-fold-containing protein [Polyplosphaeria fusca]|uniref:Histone H4 n=1 Tax=Polyplosphaeria fusca TaxID=682080 RepID=A0A9P4R4B3_9PLEO|nr:histone-fold-containing protein [Polyplosphaeria fusca]
MVNERPQQFGGTARFGVARAIPSSSAPRSSAPGSGGKDGRGLGKGKTIGMKRHKKVLRDNIHSVTKGDIRRLARRGGVKRISAMIYDDARAALKRRLEIILKDFVAVVEYSGRRTVTVRDVIFTLNRLGRPIYGFDPSFTGVR